LAKLETLVDEYRDWVRLLGPKVNTAMSEMAKLDAMFSSIGHQNSVVLLDIGEVKEKQDEVREQLIPNLERKIDSHLSKPHDLIRMTPNAR